MAGRWRIFNRGRTQKPPRLPSTTERALLYVASVIGASSEPGDIMTRYLARPLGGIRLRPLIDHIAGGRFALPAQIPRESQREIVTRAARLLSWMDGKESDAKTPQEMLGLGKSASRNEIQQQYRKMSKRLHPDLHPPSRKEYWHKRQMELNEAYQALINPEKRAQWFARVEQRNLLLRRLWQIENHPGPGR